MGNCQAIDAAALVIQHPSGKVERMYCPVIASQIMKLNPGHYVSVIIPLPISERNRGHGEDEHGGDQDKPNLFTHVKLLRPTDTLVLGRAYRLVTTQEVVKVLRAKKNVKLKRNQRESQVNSTVEGERQQEGGTREIEKCIISQGARLEGQQQGVRGSAHFGTGRSRSWRPSLQIIFEGVK